MSTALVVLIFSAATQWLEVNLPLYLASYPITDNVLFSAIWAGLVGGIGGGLVYWAGATSGRHGHRRPRDPGQDRPVAEPDLPLCGWHDCGGGRHHLRLGDGVVFDVDAAAERHRHRLCASKGPSRTRTATIITSNPQPIIDALMAELSRGVSYWDAVGGYTGEKRTIIVCTIYRPQLNDLKRIVARLDPKAFITIGVTQEALGQGFGDLSLRE